MTKPLPCPGCGKFGTMVVEGNLRCITTNTKYTCGWNEPIGTTQEEVAELKAKSKADGDAKAEALKADAVAKAKDKAKDKAKNKVKDKVKKIN